MSESPRMNNDSAKAHIYCDTNATTYKFPTPGLEHIVFKYSKCMKPRSFTSMMESMAEKCSCKPGDSLIRRLWNFTVSPKTDVSRFWKSPTPILFPLTNWSLFPLADYCMASYGWLLYGCMCGTIVLLHLINTYSIFAAVHTNKSEDGSVQAIWCLLFVLSWRTGGVVNLC